jgi:hypothetical protein
MNWFVPIFTLIAIVPLMLFWISMFSDMSKNNTLSGNSRFTWILTFLVLNVFGALLYYFNEYRNRL